MEWDIFNEDEERYADLETKKESLKKMVKAKEKCHAELQNKMSSFLMMMLKVEEICCAHSQSEMHSMKKITRQKKYGVLTPRMRWIQ
jgi:hypothetical protein